MPRTAAPFSAKEERFMAEYLIDGNGDRAATAAGYSASNARSQAYQMLRKPRIKAEINRRTKLLSAKLQLTAEKVLGDIERIANKAERAKKYGDAIKGKELLGKHLKLFTEKHEHGGIGGGPVQMHVTTADEAL
jgi:phage terminase small subunit